MIRVYFGKPGCGKTTKFVQIAYTVSKMIDKGKSPYKYIIGNIALTGIPHYYQISASTLGMIGYPNALVLIDEGSIEADSRSWANNSSPLLKYILLHRHWLNDVFSLRRSGTVWIRRSAI